MKKINYSKGLYEVYSLQFSNSVKKIPKGQIKFHKKNFIRYFKIKEKNFKNKSVFDTGAGPGVHSVILALMSKNVLAADFLEINVGRIKKLKKIYKLKNLEAIKFDFIKNFKNTNKFDLISCHNWIQHTPNPQKIFSQLILNMKLNSRVYISCYLAGTFRFFITQIARSILSLKDFKTLRKQLKIVFKDGFKKYNNIHDINEFSITDDFFSPYVVTTNYKQVIRLSEKCGLKLITKVPNFKKNLEFYDTHQLKLGFQKVKNIKRVSLGKIYTKPLDEFSLSKNNYRKKSVKLGKKIIKEFKKKKYSSVVKTNFCLNLYKIRAENSKKNNVIKYTKLYNYLSKFIKYGYND